MNTTQKEKPTVFKEAKFTCPVCGFEGTFLTGAQARQAHGSREKSCKGTVSKCLHGSSLNSLVSSSHRHWKCGQQRNAI